jgi:serine/threonine-protein kinase
MRIGKYELKTQLGQGGFGMVFIARDSELDRDCALKFLLSKHTTNPELLQRFLKEARTAAKIDHLGIVTVFECGQIANTGTEADGSAFIAMELLKGESLSERLAHGALKPTVAIEIARQIASALGAAHAAKIVHRDLKPDNVFLVPDRAAILGERVKVLDFGIAKLAEPGNAGDAGASAQTGSLMIFGTPRYMSPEQCRSTASVDGRTDIYALGVMLFEMLCGERPFDGEPGALIAMHQVVAPPTLRSRRSDLAESMEQLVSAMLAKQPTDRPQTMDDVIRRLDALSPAAVGNETLALPDASRTDTPGPTLALESIGTDATVAPAVAPTVPPTVPPTIGVARPVSTPLAPAVAAPSTLQVPVSTPPASPVSTPTPTDAPRRWPWLAAVGLVGGGIALYVAFSKSEQTTPSVPEDAPIAQLDAAVPDARVVKIPAGMALIPAAEFDMGSTEAEIDEALAWCKTLSKDCSRTLYERERPVRKVAVSAFLLDRHERSNGEVAGWLASQPNLRLDDGWAWIGDTRIIEIDMGLHADKRPRAIKQSGSSVVADPKLAGLPAIRITHQGARAFCTSLKLELPTEAQWERAARGVERRQFPWGNDKPSCDHAVFDRGPKGTCEAAGPPLVRVDDDTRDRTPEGVLHLAGNVSEWVRDGFVTPYKPCAPPCLDPIADPHLLAPARVFRGASGFSLAEQLRAAGRARDKSDAGALGTGFRCAAPAPKGSP